MSEIIQTCLKDFTLRLATVTDIPLILQMIKDLATYENLADQVVATEESLRAALFTNPLASVQKKHTGLPALY